jgi:hypothetical protein
MKKRLSMNVRGVIARLLLNMVVAFTNDPVSQLHLRRQRRLADLVTGVGDPDTTRQIVMRQST